MYQAKSSPPCPFGASPRKRSRGMFCSPPACGGSWRGAIFVLDGDYSKIMPPPLNPTLAGGRVRGVLSLIHMGDSPASPPPAAGGTEGGLALA